MTVIAVVLSALVLHAPPFRATLTAVSHQPKINTRWAYVLRVSNAKGKPLPARITAQIVDPIGGVHPLQFYANTKNITNHPIRGVFRDAVTWPPESRGFVLKLRIIVKVGVAKRVLAFSVKPR